ncbi:Zinc finger protein 804A [Sphaceloma murrayae]|uniref:Zinc finger protein 804A n=1 Tax=Sphaceloma murrayae TaxID=2082308 RepID=A0A2K1R0I5_9PEZI|nr:Zinc finger protein 804A [Sphaceloma murrayae]
MFAYLTSIRKTPFFCTLCGKGYARAPELEAHENSYDHQHKKRLKEMKAMTRNPTAAVSSSRAEKRRRENNEMLSVNLQDGGRDKEKGRGEAGTERGFKPIGLPGALVGTGDQAKADDQEEEVKPKDEYRIVEGPIPWEKLGELDQLIDLNFMRPREVQRMVDVRDEHMKVRSDPALYEAIWGQVDARGKRSVESESPPRAMGLGAS